MKEWVSIKDRMPDNGKKVICFNDKGIFLATYKKNNIWISSYCPGNEYGECCASEYGDADFWTELPEPPKEELIAEWGGNLNYIASNGTIKNCANELNRLENEDE